MMRIPMYGGQRQSRKKRRGILRRPNGQSRRKHRVRFNSGGINDTIARFFPEGKSLKIFGGDDDKKEKQKRERDERMERRRKQQEERDAKQEEDKKPVEQDDAEDGDDEAIKQMAAAGAIVGEQVGKEEESDDKKDEGSGQVDREEEQEDARSPDAESKKEEAESVVDLSDEGGDDTDEEESSVGITVEESVTGQGEAQSIPSSVSSARREIYEERKEGEDEEKEAEKADQNVGVQATTSTVDASTSMEGIGDNKIEYTEVPKGDTEALDAALGGTLLVKEGDKYFIGELYHSKLPEDEKHSYPNAFLNKTHFSKEDVKTFFDNYHACKTFKNENLIQRCYPMRSLMIAISANMYYKYYVELIQIKNIEEDFVKGNAKGMYKYLRSYADSIPQTQKALEKLGLIDPTVEEGIKKIHTKAEDLLEHLRRDVGVPVQADEEQGRQEQAASISIRERLRNIRDKKNQVHPEPETKYSGPAPTPIAAPADEDEEQSPVDEEQDINLDDRVRQEQAAVPIPTANGASGEIDGKGTGISSGIVAPENEGPSMEGAIGEDGLRDGLREGEQDGLLSSAANAEGSAGEQIDMEELQAPEGTGSPAAEVNDAVMGDALPEGKDEEADGLVDSAT